MTHKETKHECIQNGKKPECEQCDYAYQDTAYIYKHKENKHEGVE